MATADITGLQTQATYQIEAMCYALQDAARSTDTERLPYLVQSLANRIGQLNDAMMNSLAAAEPDIEELSHALYGMNDGGVSHA